MSSADPGNRRPAASFVDRPVVRPADSLPPATGTSPASTAPVALDAPALETSPGGAAAAPVAAASAAIPASAATHASPAADPARNPNRRRALLGVAGVVLLAGIAYGIYWFLVLNHYESTDNAYVQGNVVQITPQIAGTVVAINAEDTDYVKAGETLVKLDPADAHVALDQAEAQLAQGVRQVRTLFVNNGALKAQIATRQADLASARSQVARAQDDVSRRAPLVATGAVGKEEFQHATAQLTFAKANLAAAESGVQAAREQLTSNQSLTEGISVEEHPSVQQAASRVREAYLMLNRAELVSPVDGYVARRSVQLGQRVQAGAPLMSVVELDDLWVEANFKEGQLRQLRIGQPVELVADVYGSKVTYHGKVEGLGAGTGSAFALLPAQNAAGNWIKVVQRVPVRIALDQAEVKSHPLRVGLSMVTKVDVTDTHGRMLAGDDRQHRQQRQTLPQTLVPDADSAAADAAVQRIITANLGRPVSSRGATNAVAGRHRNVRRSAGEPTAALAQAAAKGSANASARTAANQSASTAAVTAER